VASGPGTQAGYTLRHSDPVVVEGLGEDSRFQSTPLLAEHGVVSGISVVIPGAGEDGGPFGTLGAHATARHNFTDDDVAFMQGVAHVLAGAVEREQREADLRDSEARARAILETTVDAIITIDAYGRIESFNAAAERIFGFSAAEAVGENISILMPEPYRAEHDDYLESYRRTGRRRIIGIGREVTGRRKDGSTFPMDLAVSEVHLGDRVIFTGIVRDITERRHLEQEVLRISEAERRRIGQDLHDELGQMLTGIGLIGQSLQRRLETHALPGAAEVAEITRLIKEADQHARGLARGLVPVELEANGLTAALRQLAASSERLFNIRCVFDELGSPVVGDAAMATHVYRIAQEAISNAVRHGKARSVWVALSGGHEGLRLRVHDNGIGFPDVLPEDRGMGVRIMHHRARIIGGSLEISRDPAGGTSVICTVPRIGRRPAPTDSVNSISP
jgi:two-component system, LuxR family, sensor kinase FixL